MKEMKRPLEGIHVVELATYIAAPCCARFLSDMGAQVVKVESAKGDPLRYFATNEGRPFGDQEDTTFTLENTGKQCIILNTKSEDGREALERLIARADVLITNWRQDALKRCGLDYESLKIKYPALVMGHVSGYGEKGHDCNLPGFDFTAYYARGGILGTMYDKDSSPMMPVPGFGDHQTGLFLAAGVVSALYKAKMTGIGDYVSTSLFHTALWDMGLCIQSNQYGDPSMQYPIRRHENTNPLNMAQKTKDGHWFQISMPSYNIYYNRFMKAIGREDLVDDPRFYPQDQLMDHLEIFYSILEEEIGMRTQDEMVRLMIDADLPYALCQTWDEVLKDSQAWESEALTKVDFPNGNERSMVRTPVILKEAGLAPYKRAAFLGENTQEVLASLGYTSDEIRQMVADGDAGSLTRIG